MGARLIAQIEPESLVGSVSDRGLPVHSEIRQIAERRAEALSIAAQSHAWPDQQVDVTHPLLVIAKNVVVVAASEGESKRKNIPNAGSPSIFEPCLLTASVSLGSRWSVSGYIPTLQERWCGPARRQR